MTNSLTRRNLVRLLGGAAATGGFLAVPAHAAWTPNDKKKVNMISRSTRPEDLEMPLDGFLNEITPVERFFTRSHHYTPKVDLATWRLEVTGAVSKPQSLTFEAIQKLPKHGLPAVLECAGNGRAFYEPSVPGLQWEFGGVANAQWSGARLTDVLKLAGVDENAVELVFDGADVPIGTMPDFQRSITLRKALDGDTLLAYEMNGQPLPTAHGFPLRLIVPGWAGDCWVKWVKEIKVSKTEFDGFFMKSAYRHPGKAVKPGSAVDPALMTPVTTLAVKSVIATPLDGAEFEVGKPINFRGVAWSGSGNTVNRVEITLDGGQTWAPAQPGSFANAYSWRTWQFTYLPEKEEFLNVGVRCGDSGGRLQPMVAGWNPSGYLYNAIHTIGINVAKQSKDAPAPSSAKPSADGGPPVYRQACIGCHEDDVIRQQRLTRAQWDREVDKMARWGSQFKPSDKDAIVDYLSKEYPYRKR